MKKNDLDLYVELVKTAFKLRYRGSVLGFLWVLMKPFLMFTILFVVFSKIGANSQGLSSSEYAIYLLSGLVIFNFFNEGIIWGMRSILDRSNIILKIKFDRGIAVISYITIALINFVINAFIIAGVCVVLGVSVTLSSVIYILIIGAIIFSIIYGISLFLSIALVHFRDLTHITELLMQLLFYGSAVFYPIEMVPDKWRFLVELNPIAIFISTVREALLFGRLDRIEFVAIIAVVSGLIIILGTKFFNKKINKIAESF